MRSEVVNAFVDAIVHVVRGALSEVAHPAAWRFDADVDRAPSIVVSIELTGALRGPVTWSFAPSLARQVANRLVAGDADEALHSAAVAELANMMLGNATAALEEAGFLVEIHPPTVEGADARRTGPQAIVVDVATPSGAMKLLLDLEEAA